MDSRLPGEAVVGLALSRRGLGGGSVGVIREGGEFRKLVREKNGRETERERLARGKKRKRNRSPPPHRARTLPFGFLGIA